MIEKTLITAALFLTMTLVTSASAAGLFPRSWLYAILSGSPQPSIISPATLIPLGGLIAGIGITVAATWRVAIWANDQAHLRDSLSKLQDRVARLEERVKGSGQ